LQQVTSLGRRAQADTSAVSYWLRPRGAVSGQSLQCAIALSRWLWHSMCEACLSVCACIVCGGCFIGVSNCATWTWTTAVCSKDRSVSALMQQPASQSVSQPVGHCIYR